MTARDAAVVLDLKLLSSPAHVTRRSSRERGGADDEDPDELTFELNGMILAANTNYVLHHDPSVLDLARRAFRRRLRVPATSDG